MSAAAPPPPSRPPPGAPVGGYDSRTAGAGASQSRGGDMSGQSGRRALPHINDLRAKAEERVHQLFSESRHAPISHLLEAATRASTASKAYADFRRPDAAYVEFLVASDLVLNYIPNHKDFTTLKAGEIPHITKSYNELVRYIRTEQDRFDSIKDIISNENKRSGIAARTGRGSDTPGSRPSSAGQQAGTGRPTARNPRYSMPPSPLPRTDRDSLRPTSRSSVDLPPSLIPGKTAPAGAPDSPRRRPLVNSKPPGLQGRAVEADSGSHDGSANSVDILAQRFARLRPNGSQNGLANGFATDVTVDPPASLPPVSDLTVKMPSPTDYIAPAPRPLGPRSMPNAPTGPPHPPKLPLNTSIPPSLPKAPSPTYSPARNLSTPVGIEQPRSTARSMVGSGGRNASPHASNGTNDSYFPTNASTPSKAVRRKSVHLPREFQINAEKLFDYLKMYNILLIDVRSRSEFDEGHIWSQRIMCIDPNFIREGMSAEELQDSLVLSPDEEQTWFSQRDQFDLIVYYDQSTPSTDFMNKTQRTAAESALKYLHDALYELNIEKPLQRPPILLMGGLNAWIDLLGQQSLYMSAAASSRKVGRPIQRVPVPSNQSRINLQRRRLREYNPMDAEEERKWREQTRSERVALEQRSASEDFINGHGPELPQIYRTTEDFLRRYPDPATIEQESMVLPPQRSHVPATYQAPSVPAVPSRPPPSVPRVSYSGVHERDHPRYGSQDRGAQLPAYVPPRSHPQNRMPKTGLINFGVTCYMNSTIQCLSATLPMTRIFRENRYLNLVQRDNWKGSKGLMSEVYATLIQSLWQGDVGACRPTSFRRLCGRLNKEWGIDQQQDAKEFLEFLLDILHEDLNTQWARSPLKELTEKEEAARESLPKPLAAYFEWGRYTHREKSIISDLFAGQHASRLRCTACHFTSTTYEAFFSISVEIPRDRPADLRDCLRSYCAEERLSGDEVWKCPNCKKEREATKKITITRAPQFLIVHFKRFSAGHQERARKVRTPIEFPLDGLNLEPYMMPPLTAPEEDFVARRNGPDLLQRVKADPAMRPPYVYHAYGVIRHLGATLGSGHYVSLVKDPARGCWLQFNDDKVTEFDPHALRGADRLQNEQAYIVFFEREGVHSAF